MLKISKRKLAKLYHKKEMTLQDIGNKYGVTRERIRQVMEEYGLSRRVWNISLSGRTSISRFTDIDDYFSYIRKGGKESKYQLKKFISPGKMWCEDCSSVLGRLHIHHLRYPAKSIKDIKVLCVSCHVARHNKGNGNIEQQQICNEYSDGLKIAWLARKHRISIGLIYYFLRKWGVRTKLRNRMSSL